MRAAPSAKPLPAWPPAASPPGCRSRSAPARGPVAGAAGARPVPRGAACVGLSTARGDGRIQAFAKPAGGTNPSLWESRCRAPAHQRVPTVQRPGFPLAPLHSRRTHSIPAGDPPPPLPRMLLPLLPCVRSAHKPERLILFWAARNSLPRRLASPPRRQSETPGCNLPGRRCGYAVSCGALLGLPFRTLIALAELQPAI